MNRLCTDKRVMILQCLVEGNSIRGTSRITSTSKDTVIKLLCDVGQACWEYQDRVMRDLPCLRLECDELWTFVYCKGKTSPLKPIDRHGTFWTWTALCPDTKIIPCWYIGERDVSAARMFMKNLSGRFTNRVQITTDGFKGYIPAVRESFGRNADFAMVKKIYLDHTEFGYRQYTCKGVKKVLISGKPTFKEISTSYCERNNLTMRMSMRRYIRKTSGFSKTVKNLKYAVALHFMYYNFCRKHETLKMTPAMKSGISDRQWGIKDILYLLKVHT